MMERTCGFEDCQNSLEGKQATAKFCSKRCKDDAYRGPYNDRRREARRDECYPTGRICGFEGCQNTLDGRNSRARFCSGSCRAMAWAQRNPKRFNEIKATYYRQNVDARRAVGKSHYRENTQSYIDYANRRQGRIRGSIYRFTQRDWERLLDRYYHRCAYCGVAEKLEREHVVPLSRGGDHRIGNIVPACRSCNRSKFTKLLSEWRYKNRLEVISNFQPFNIDRTGPRRLLAG